MNVATGRNLHLSRRRGSQYVDDLREVGLGLAAGFRLKVAELPSSVALVEELVAPVAFC